MRAEGIYAHGYHSHACKMAVALAHDMLKSPPILTLTASTSSDSTAGALTSGGAKGKKKRISAASHALTHMASTTLSHCAFLCTVLSEVPDFHSLAFQVSFRKKYSNLISTSNVCTENEQKPRRIFRSVCLVLRWPDLQRLPSQWRSS
jgi:hypothetical protein